MEQHNNSKVKHDHKKEQVDLTKNFLKENRQLSWLWHVFCVPVTATARIETWYEVTFLFGSVCAE